MTDKNYKKKYSYKRFISESFLIIFSVLFALGINEWRTSVHENKRTRIILENIKAELLGNQKITKEFVEYHEFVKKNIENAYVQDSLESKFYPKHSFEIFNVAPNGIVQKSFQDIAWEVAKQERLSSRIEFKKSSALFQVYIQQETVNETIDRIIYLLSEREIQRKNLLHENVILLGAEFDELIGQEKYLLNMFNRALKVLEE